MGCADTSLYMPVHWFYGCPSITDKTKVICDISLTRYSFPYFNRLLDIATNSVYPQIF